MMYIALLLNHSGKNLGASNLRYVAKKNATQTQKISLKMRNPFVCIFKNETDGKENFCICYVSVPDDFFSWKSV